MSDAAIQSSIAELLQHTQAVIPVPLPEHQSWAALGLDSLDLAELAARIEQRYRIEIPDADWRGLHDVADLVSYLQTRLEDHGRR
jgi:acyl carrier protein